jgi:hypothetical protein
MIDPKSRGNTDVNPLKKKIGEKEKLKRLEFLKKQVTSILEGLNNGALNLDEKVFIFFGYITHDFQFPPKQFFFKFEINRL